MGFLDWLDETLGPDDTKRVVRCPATNGTTNVKCGAVVTEIRVRYKTPLRNMMGEGDAGDWTKDYRCPSCGRTIKVQCIRGCIYTSVVR